ncbi:hypothetical protein F4813DRAFT_353944 [Daldinia decipiens]|uniref:uncharacterized protein n=1 Tax=Daldinia decipiens TaxID=326647 RepID=UPI0020C47287|nr:uncharacterized protein F4813DRAFT_353944 [Daldinia decipiens]KAI1659118.1 hypothetical protein F4813DRAFT_353944 [Daldinia decipiens]
MSYNISAEASGSTTRYLSGWNQHDYYYYVGVSGYPVSLERLMELQKTEDQFEAWVEQVKQAQQTGYPYALREMGVVGPIGLAGVTDVFGTALWALNFLLYASSFGIASVGLHMTGNSNASAWLPIPMYGQQPHVRPLYYGIAAFDQVIGRLCAARVSQYQIPLYPPSYDGFLRAYAIYQQEQLASIVVVNGKMVNSSQDHKDGIAVQLQLPPSTAGQTVYLSYLTSPGAESTENTTWNGISFEQNGDGTPTQVSDDEHTVDVDANGIANFMLRDSEAVAASIGGKLSGGIGKQESSKAATCLTMPGKSPGVGSPVRPTSSAGTNSENDDSKKSGTTKTYTLTKLTSVGLLPMNFWLIIITLML